MVFDQRERSGHAVKALEWAECDTPALFAIVRQAPQANVRKECINAGFVRDRCGAGWTSGRRGDFGSFFVQRLAPCQSAAGCVEALDDAIVAAKRCEKNAAADDDG